MLQVEQVKIGKLEKVPLREVWRHEAHNFTHWLAKGENLKQLGDACSINLEFVGREVAVGPYAADIVAKESGTDRTVVIENQLGDTDHDHLGKIITYAAGQNAEIAIWVVAQASEPHKKAIEWLNEHTDSQHSFFLVEIETFRIGDSKPAPQFNVVQAPNFWARTEKMKAGLKGTELVLLEFWQAFRVAACSDQEFLKLMLPPKPTTRNYNDIKLRTSRYHLAVHAQKSRIGVEVCIPTDKEFGKIVSAHREELEQLLGVNGKPYEKKSCGIRFFREGCNIKEKPELWEEYIAWQLSAAVKLRQAMLKIDRDNPAKALEQSH